MGLTAAASSADAKKILGSGTTTLTLFNNDLKGIIKIVQSL